VSWRITLLGSKNKIVRKLCAILAEGDLTAEQLASRLGLTTSKISRTIAQKQSGYIGWREEPVPAWNKRCRRRYYLIE